MKLSGEKRLTMKKRGDATIKSGNDIEQATHWMPMPEAFQEVNRG